MNERIIEIHKECIRLVRWDKSELDVEKFAELLVKECVRLVQDTHPDDFAFIEGKLLNHFGMVSNKMKINVENT